jgi:ribosomal protein S18 acetylase RimI-like enzyme
MSLSLLFENDTTGGLICKEKLRNTFIGYVINISHKQIDSICELVLECQSKLLLKNLEKIDNYDLNQGFLIHEWSIENLKKLLSSFTSSLICIIDETRNKLAGYLLLTSIDNLIDHMNPEVGQFVLDQNFITDERWKQAISSPHIRYIEQSGVDTEYHRQGIGSTLIALAKNQSSQDICTCVMSWPYPNVASANLKTKNGFKPIGIWNQTTCTEFAPFKATVYMRPFEKSTLLSESTNSSI